MAVLKPQQQANINRLMKHLRLYLNARADFAVRVNPRVKNIVDDMIFHHFHRVLSTLTFERMFGPVRFMVADILMSTDITKRNALFSPMDQNSIMTMLVAENKESNEAKKRAGVNMPVYDLKSLYESLDPSLNKFMVLIESWVWWDLLDSSLCGIFEERLERLRNLVANEGIDKTELSRHLENRPPEMSLEELTEIKFDDLMVEEQAARLAVSLVRVRAWFKAERDRDEAFKIILKRDSKPDSFDEMTPIMVECGKRLRAMEAARKSTTIEPNLLSYYAKQFSCAPQEVTPERIANHETAKLQELLPRLNSVIARHDSMGEPYDLKHKQQEEMDAALVSLRGLLSLPANYPILRLAQVERHRTAAEEEVDEFDAAAHQSIEADHEGPMLF
ncbi:hypothetical protein JXA32_09580 [Candidatus Sumerlaeota bacterium]|nr:hypothetical protein [Candidatus Sumerlaeota bacterium]